MGALRDAQFGREGRAPGGAVAWSEERAVGAGAVRGLQFHRRSLGAVGGRARAKDPRLAGPIGRTRVNVSS
ncbi:hypothetical protein GCM10011490_25930 [Pseudoclavibacter endophyticus]|nr:hypothetical protein GCM10011490_25930 [Pseudoclavibacter endophyticus]